RSKSFDAVISNRIGPFISMRPQSKVELNSPLGGLIADEAQRLQIAFTLGIGYAGRGHVVSGYFQQERIGQVEVRIRDVARAVVTDTESQIKAVESVRRKHR